MNNRDIQQEATDIMEDAFYFGTRDWKENLSSEFSRYNLNFSDLERELPDLTRHLPAVRIAQIKKDLAAQPTDVLPAVRMAFSDQTMPFPLLLPGPSDQEEKPEALKPAPVRKWGRLDNLAAFSIGASLVFLAMAIYWFVSAMSH